MKKKNKVNCFFDGDIIDTLLRMYTEENFKAAKKDYIDKSKLLTEALEVSSLQSLSRIGARAHLATLRLDVTNSYHKLQNILSSINKDT